jgi:outer membrane receptor protein involved in Fe transport
MKRNAFGPLPALALVAAVLPAGAQQAAEKLERIEITGSRLPISSEVDTASPVVIIRAEDIRIDGYPSVELILNNLPQFAADQGTRISNGATGTATANLRALGAQRTLVLMNGRRMPAGSPGALSPDLNQIPPQLIQRVEILTGGASAVYGADAIAGVVNFILNDRFEGVQADASYGFYNHRQKSDFAQELLRQRNIPVPGDKDRDGGISSASLTLGGNFQQDKGNAVVSFRYLKTDALLQSERDYSACAIGVVGGEVACGGSGVSNPGRFLDLGYFAGDPFFEPRDPQSFTIDRATGRVRRFRGSDLYNYAPLNYYQRPQERYGFNAFVNYDLSAQARLYSDFGYHDDRSLAQVAASGMFFVPAQVRWENPLLNDDWRATLVFRDRDGNVSSGPGTVANMQLSRRNTEGGGRVSDQRHTSFREVLGLKGTVGHWDYDAFFQTGRVNYQQRYSNDFSFSRSLRAVDVVADPVTGAPVCASALSGVDPACVPYNLWSLDSVSPAALAYLQIPAFQRAVLTQRVMGGTVSTNLGDFGIRLPGTRQAAELALGIERRTEKMDSEADESFADLIGFGQPVRAVSGGLTVNEVFGELRVPLFDIATVSGSYRWSDYDNGVKTDTYGFGFNAAPWKSIRLRGSYQRAVRAPNVNELFEPQFPGFWEFEGGDPCAGPSPARSLADCQRTGVTASAYGRILDSPDREFHATRGGNPLLGTESASTYTLGVGLTPWRNFSATIDYFDVRLEDAIIAMEPDVIFRHCIDTGNPLYCALVVRDPATQSLWFGQANVIAINRNVGRSRVSGIDLALNYRLRLPQGHVLAFDLLGTHLRKQSIQLLLDGPTSVCEGQYDSDCAAAPLPRWRHRFRTTWSTPWNFEVAATWRFIGSTESSPIITTFFERPFTIPAVNYFDVAGSWNVTKRVTLRAGVNNIADRDPPLLAGFGFQLNGNTFAQTYDALGRHVFVSATARF